MGLNHEHYCDHCGMLIRSRRSLCAVYSLPIGVSSAEAGESATLCKPCHDDVMEADALMDKAHAIMEKAAQRGPKPDELDADGRPGLGHGRA